MTTYSNHPLVEIWLWYEFSFDPEQSPDWDEHEAREFFSRYSEQFPTPEFRYRAQFQVKGNHESPEIRFAKPQLNRVRATNVQNSRCLQLGFGELVYNWLKADETFLGFEAFLDEALGKVAEYE